MGSKVHVCRGLKSGLHRFQLRIGEYNPGALGFFTNSSQYKNANVASFVLAVPLETTWTNEVCNLEM